VEVGPSDEKYSGGRSAACHIDYGLDQTRQALAVFRTIGFSNLLLYFGHMPKSRGCRTYWKMDWRREEALEAARSTDMLHYNAEFIGLKASYCCSKPFNIKILSRRSENCRAESCYNQAIEVAQRHNPKSLELRPRQTWRVITKQDRREEARKRLMRSIHGSWRARYSRSTERGKLCKSCREQIKKYQPGFYG